MEEQVELRDMYVGEQCFDTGHRGFQIVVTVSEDLWCTVDVILKKYCNISIEIVQHDTSLVIDELLMKFGFNELEICLRAST